MVLDADGYLVDQRLNPVFTRAVNHCDVLGKKAAIGRDKRASLKIWLAPNLNLELECQRG